MRTRIRRRILCGVAALLCGSAAQATWSIILINSETREIAFGAATCLQGLNLRQTLPVMIVDVGAAAAQASIDGSGTNRRVIWDQFRAGTDPVEILAMLAASDPQHQTRQYGIVDVHGRVASFSGSQNSDYANNLQGQFGSITYSIQGNILTGAPVLEEALAAAKNTPGGLPEKLMAGMEAARAMGGDGRCSCPGPEPTGCGAPPASFEKSAHVGFMLVSRRGDVNEGQCNNGGGCARGPFYLALNNQGRAPDPDPVLTMRKEFDAWRASLVGVVDAVESRATLSTPRVLTGGETITLNLELLDWQGLPATGVTAVEVTHDTERGAVEACEISPATPLGDGVYEVTLTTQAVGGIERLLIKASDDAGDHLLIPSPQLLVQDRRADLNHDGAVTLDDLLIQLAAFATSADGDVDDDGDTDLADLAVLLTSLDPG